MSNSPYCAATGVPSPPAALLDSDSARHDCLLQRQVNRTTRVDTINEARLPAVIQVWTSATKIPTAANTPPVYRIRLHVRMKSALHVNTALLKNLYELLRVDAGTNRSRNFKQHTACHYMIMADPGVVRIIPLDT